MYQFGPGLVFSVKRPLRPPSPSQADLGDSTECEAEAPAMTTLRGRVALVTASCPRQYLRDVTIRKRQGRRIPADMEDAKDFLGAVRRTLGSTCNQTLEMATCLAVFHSRKRKSSQQQERKLLVAVRMSGYFPHQRVPSRVFWLCFCFC